MFTEGLDDEQYLDRATPADGIMASRSQTLARIATGKTVADRTEWVDPARCRPWRMHNRDLDHLNEDSCRDLIDSFLSAKKQRIPAIVRRLKDDPDFRSGLGGQYKSFKANLLPALTTDEFADLYAETITYGMFAARFHDDDLSTFSSKLGSIFGGHGGRFDEDEVGR